MSSSDKRSGRSEEKTDWLGNKYVQHYDSDGRQAGRSEEKTDWLGNDYVQHYDSGGDKTGRSEDKADWLGNEYVQHYDPSGDRTGRSEDKADWLANEYVQHYDSDGERAGQSEDRTDWLGNEYIQHSGPRTYARPASGSGSTSSASYSAPTRRHQSAGDYDSPSPSVASGFVLKATLWLIGAFVAFEVARFAIGLPNDWLLGPRQSFETSYDCSKATSWAEKEVCASSQFAADDVQMAALYRQALASSPAANRHSVLKEQRQWIAATEACLDDQCIESAYASRLQQLSN